MWHQQLPAACSFLQAQFASSSAMLLQFHLLHAINWTKWNYLTHNRSRGQGTAFLMLIKYEQTGSQLTEDITVKHYCNVPGVSGVVSFYPRGQAVVPSLKLIWLWWQIISSAKVRNQHQSPYVVISNSRWRKKKDPAFNIHPLALSFFNVHFILGTNTKLHCATERKFIWIFDQLRKNNCTQLVSTKFISIKLA